MQKIVLVTGASTGIGYDTVRALTVHGFLVVASVRKDEDKANLLATFGNQIRIIKVDLTDFAEVEKLPELLKRDFNISELHGLVNNAGIALAAPFAHQNFSEVQSILQINVLAIMKITQVLIPLLKSGSRIVNISSISGKSAAPFLAVYAASKYALEGFSEALRKELILLGIKVIIVGPGSIKTPIWKKGFEIIKDKYSKTAYAESFTRFINFAADQEKMALEVTDVSSMIVEALSVKNPKFRYAPVPHKFLNWYLPMLLPARLFDYLTAKALGLKP